MTTAATSKAVWGPAAWTFLHAAAAVCDDPDGFRELLRAAARCLPCRECRREAGQYLQEAAEELAAVDGKVAASRFLWKMHNAVNARLGKPSFRVEELRRRYGVDASAPQRRDGPQRLQLRDVPRLYRAI